MDVVRKNIDERIIVKMKGARQLTGKLHAFDQHLNLVLGDVEETTIQVEGESEHKEKKRNIKMLFVRGDGIILLGTE